MSKQTQKRRRDGQASLDGQKHQLASVRHSGGSMQAATTVDEPAVSRHTARAVAGPTHEQIAVRAYQVWEAHGRPVGTDREDWMEAEQILHADAR